MAEVRPAARRAAVHLAVQPAEQPIPLHRTAFMMSSRGGGNYSVRFYEALRSGRIPVLLESDMIFPFEEEIDWGEICICRPTPEEVAETMIDWWENRDIAAIQKKCREVWEPKKCI